MNEDEILKDIDNYITFANKSENFSDINEYLHCKELARRMKGLLDLYKQEKEKNKKIKNARLYVVGRRTGKEAEQKIYLKEYISKDKIIEKIKELEEKSDYWNCDEIEVLKELLKEN
jgi:CRISPR/Cas system-associated exonuclease Cas4 (RecB family)